MKLICLLILAACLLAACATSVPPEYEDESRFVAVPATEHAAEQEESPDTYFDTAEPWPRALEMSRLDGPRHVGAFPGMPFGESMFGPWRTGLEPDPSFPRAVGRLTVEPVPVDLVGKPLHTVLYYIAARAGAQLSIGPDVPNPRVTVMFRDVDPKEAVRALCKAHKLFFIEEGNVWAIGSSDSNDRPVNVTKGDFDGYYHADFDEQELVQAIMEVARVTGAQVLIPATLHDADDGEEARIRKIQEQPITLRVRNATADHILRELARLGNMDIEVILPEGDQPAYKFKYRK